MKQLKTARSYTSARSLLLKDNSQNFLSTLLLPAA
ncbi:unnamed protein product [Penicillium camemberti]|uniref:Str. FM013 n=1 Tax=Penicillium camemberti (strain FM 013) TaxID=1429867 RepID=A0A0G4PY69_PENC3|nr:unnamed protein product [Penicillium camemberti]